MYLEKIFKLDKPAYNKAFQFLDYEVMPVNSNIPKCDVSR